MDFQDMLTNIVREFPYISLYSDYSHIMQLTYDADISFILLQLKWSSEAKSPFICTKTNLSVLRPAAEFVSSDRTSNNSQGISVYHIFFSK